MSLTIPTLEVGPLLPLLILTAGALLVLLVDACWQGRRGWLTGLSLLSLAGAAAAAGITWGPARYAFSRMFVADPFTHAFTFIFLLGTVLTLLLSHHYAAQEGIASGEYFSLLLFSAIGMILMAGGSNLVTIFLGLEVMSVAMYILAGFFKARPASSEASLKYFLLGAFATGFLLYGMALIYGATGSLDLERIGSRLADPGPRADPLLLVGMGLLIVGFGFKVAAVPFHMWTPDVYEGAPTSVTGYMAASVKAAGFAAFFRVFGTALPALHGEWTGILWALALLTMTLGNLAAIAQRNLKRMLAYSSIAHAGYVLIALIALNRLGMASLLFYMFQYTLSTLGAFGVLIALGTEGKERLDLDDFNGLGYRHPFLGFAMSLFMFSLAGLPPTAGFVGKFYVFSAAVEAGYVGLVIVGVLNSVISVYYYLGVLVHMYMQEPLRAGSPDGPAGQGAPEEGFVPEAVGGAPWPREEPLRPGLLTLLAVLLAAYGTLHLGILPGRLLALAQASVAFLL